MPERGNRSKACGKVAGSRSGSKELRTPFPVTSRTSTMPSQAEAAGGAWATAAETPPAPGPLARFPAVS